MTLQVPSLQSKLNLRAETISTVPFGSGWYYSQRGITTGPISLADLQRKIQAGNVHPDDRVRSQEMVKWLPAREVLAQSESQETIAPPAAFSLGNQQQIPATMLQTTLPEPLFSVTPLNSADVNLTPLPSVKTPIFYWGIGVSAILGLTIIMLLAFGSQKKDPENAPALKTTSVPKIVVQKLPQDSDYTTEEQQKLRLKQDLEERLSQLRSEVEDLERKLSMKQLDMEKLVGPGR